VELSASEKDYATLNMLQWFVAEQVEEEANPNEIMLKVKVIGPSAGGLLYLDKELRKREYHAPNAG
jgi:ferritin